MRFRFVRDFASVTVPESNHRSWTFRGEAYYSLREASRRLGLGVCTVQSRARQGRIRATLVNGRPWMPSWVMVSMLAKKAGRKYVEYFVAAREGAEKDRAEFNCFDDHELAAAVSRLAPAVVRREKVKTGLFEKSFRFYSEILVGNGQNDREPVVATFSENLLSVECDGKAYALPLPLPEGFPATLDDIRGLFLSGADSSVTELMERLFQ